MKKYLKKFKNKEVKNLKLDLYVDVYKVAIDHVI